jgi:hypothetical protein
MSALLGAIGGGVLGSIGGVLSGIDKKKAATKFRRRQRRAIRQSREFADERINELLGDPSRFLRPAGEQERVGGLIQGLSRMLPGGKFGGGIRDEIGRFGSRVAAGPAPPRTLYERGVQFLAGTFDRPEDSPLADQLRKSLRVAQESRGLRRSVAGAVGEARALGAFTQNLRASLLPSMMQFSTLPEQLRQSIIGFEAPLRTAAATGAPVPGLGPVNPGSLFPGVAGGIFQQGVAGALGGFQMGSAISAQAQQVQQNEQLIEAIRQSRQPSLLDQLSGAGARLFGFGGGGL